MIYQDLALARQQDVASNIFLGREPVRSILGMRFVDRATMKREAQAMINRLGAKLPAINRPVGTFSGGQQQSVAIARALTFDPKVVIMDEPTAALGVQETAQVENIIRNLKARGIPLILISHNLRQVFDLVDKIWVFRRGRIAGMVERDKTDGNEVVSLITGVKSGVGEQPAFV
jgi:ABC-type sugar transport system ATPase subunit